jgi:hypothetical protein
MLPIIVNINKKEKHLLLGWYLGKRFSIALIHLDKTALVDRPIHAFPIISKKGEKTEQRGVGTLERRRHSHQVPFHQDRILKNNLFILFFVQEEEVCLSNLSTNI